MSETSDVPDLNWADSSGAIPISGTMFQAVPADINTFEKSQLYLRVEMEGG